ELPEEVARGGAERAEIGIRNQLQHGDGRRVDQRRRNYRVWKERADDIPVASQLPGKRIEDGDAKRREIAIADGGGRNAAHARGCRGALARTLIVDKKEGLVANDTPAENA